MRVGVAAVAASSLRVRRSRALRSAASGLASTLLAFGWAASPVVTPVLADPLSPLTVTKTATPNPVASGSQLTYTIGIVNTGGAKVTNVVMTDQVSGVGVIQAPPALPQLIITSSQGPCSQGGPNGNVVSCQIGTMNGGKSVTITIRGQVTASNGTTLNNTASVTGTKSAQNFTTTGSVSVLVSGGSGGSLADLTINKTGPTAVDSLASMAYNLTVNNLGTANATNVKVVDTLPSGVAFVGTSTTSLFSCTHSGANPDTVTCTGGAVNAGQNGSITINTTAPDAGPPPATIQITNTAVVDPDNAIAESNELNNTSATVYTTVGGPAPTSLLSIVKTDGLPEPAGNWWTGAGPDPVTPGQKITYKIQVTNNATGTNSRADDVVVTDGTQGLEASSIVASQVVANGTVGNTGGCVVNAPQVRCSIRSLNSLGTLTITIVGTVVASAGTTIFNTATVTGNIKNTGVTATDSEETTVRPAVDLTITKDDSPDPVCARSWPTAAPNQHLPQTANPPGAPPAGGSPTALLAATVCLGGLRYDMVVGNSGTLNATGVLVRDPLPPGTIFDSYSTSGNFVCGVDAANVVTCTGDVPGATPPASQSTVNLSFLLVAPPGVGSITNTVTVDPNNSIFEPDETNNTATQTTAVATGVDLVTWKSDSKSADPPGDGAPTLTPGTSTDLGDGYDPIATRGTETYTIYVDNVGTQDVTGIRLRDTLPADTVFLSVVADATHGFTCSQSGGVVECVGGHLLGTESEFYKPAGSGAIPPGDDFATIKIRVFARATVGTMHNEVRVDPLNEIAEVNELNNVASDDTTVTVGDADKGAYQQLTIEKSHVSPAAGTVATNGTLIYKLHVSNLGTDPISNIVVTDTLPAGTRYIEAKDTSGGSHAFFCAHDGAPTGGIITCTGGDLDGSIVANQVNGGVTARDITVKVFAPNTPGTYTNQAGVDPNNLVPEGNEFDNDTQLQTTVASCISLANCTTTNAFYELTIDKTQVTPDDPAARNGIITYDLKVENLGSDSVSGVTVTDRLPAGFVFISAKDTSGGDPEAFTCAGPDSSGVVTCNGGSLSGTANPIPGGAPTVRHIRIRVFAPDTPGAYTNLAFVDPTNAIPEGNEFNNQDSLVTNVTNGGKGPYIDLTVDKTQEKVLDQIDDPNDATRAQVAPGQGIKYVLEVKNLATGPDSGTAFNVRVRDVLPQGTTFFKAEDEAAGPGNFSCGLLPGQPSTVECIGGTIPAGDSRKIDVILVAPTGLDQIASDQGNIFQILTNTAFVDPLNEILEGDETNNVDSVKTTVKSKVNLTVVSKDGPDQAQQNQEADYTITVKNEKVWGDGAIAVDAHVLDYLPVGLIPLSVSTDVSNMACQLFENPVNYVDCVGDMEPDQQVVITVHVFITAASGTMDNEACIDPDHLIDETTELDNCKTKTTDIGGTPTTEKSSPNLIVNKSASTSVVTPGETFTYTVTLSNVGTASAANPVTLTDTLPADVTLVGTPTATNGFTCSGTTTISCTDAGLGLAPGASTVVTIQVQVSASASLPITNTASVPAATADLLTSPCSSDPSKCENETAGNQANNSDSVITSVGSAGVELVLANVEDAPDPVTAGGVVTYTIVVANAGTSDANGLDVTQTFSSTTGLTFLSAVGSQGFTCSFSDPVVTCTGNLLAGQTTVLTVKFDTDASAVPSVFSIIEVDPNAEFTETDEGNNTDFEATTVDPSPCQNCIDLVMGPIFASPDPVTNGDQVTWNFDVTNVGDLPTSSDPAPNTVTIEINVDSSFNEYTGLSVSIPGWSCTVTSHAGDSGNGAPEAVCTKANMNAGEGALAAVTVTSNTAVTPSVLFFSATVDPGTQITEFNEANNSGSKTVTVQ